ncbi:disease resistance protein RPM1-like [Senna tora]|uniref:Disease resistance protein RPM1-like n=1 Tax=Senna tora TaxID=362788 RepID=A0A834T8I5_9FABA|nr:disease resistance protein RPM1-like [Senna tora]
MAEIAVNIVIDKLIPLLRDEVTLLRGVHGEIGSIKDQLGLIKAYLKDADARAERTDGSNAMKEWVKQVREIAYRIEDVIDEYSFKEEKRGRKQGIGGVVSRTSQLLRSVVPRHEISDEIGEIRESLARLNEGRVMLGLDPSGGGEGSGNDGGDGGCRRNDLRLGAQFMDDGELVGVDQTRKMVRGWLFSGDPRRTVVSVVGEGGLGKTTVVSNVYKKQMDERCFDSYAWITVSRSHKVEELLKTMMKNFYEYDSNKSGAVDISEIKDMKALFHKLREYLEGRRYMIVFDDVWDIDFWGEVEFALPDNNNKNRIMITTRDRGVADFCRRFAPVHVHELKPLPLEDAMKLFLHKAFQFDQDNEGCPEELIGFSQNVVNKCDGVPLAIVAIAGLLSTKKKLVSEWQKVLNSLHSKLASDPHLRGYYQVLSESYSDLSYHLKLCLLYFGLFPEDHSISCVKLINLWIMEGFVKKSENKDETTLEEIAEEYLEELIRRSLVKISDVHPYGRVRTCGVHDLMHDFILKKCEEMNFCQVKNRAGLSFHALARRISIQTNSVDDLQSTTNLGKVRSCFVFNFEDFPKPMVKSFLSSFKLLIGLDLEGAPLDYLPEAVGNLFNLKYLSLRRTNVRIIPKFIGKLQNLESLDLKDTEVSELPIEIYKLVKLRHLIAYSYALNTTSTQIVQGVKLNEGIGCLRALEKLACVDVTDDGDGVIDELKSLKHMRRLSIIGVRRHHGKVLCSAIESMNHLCSLSIKAANEHEVVDLQSLKDPPQNLQRLYLHIGLVELPQWIVKLDNLVKLRLYLSMLKEDQLSVLKSLPLLELQLSRSVEVDELHFKDGWFRKLKTLEICMMQGLRTVKIGKGALPSLEELTLQQCPQLVEMPNDIRNLETLKSFCLCEMPDELIICLKEQGGNYDKIKEITFVTSFEQGLFNSRL